MNLILENIRTFVGPHKVPLRPLTILTGENSSGKSTFLACLSAVTSPVGYPFDPKFNEPPYNLGSFDSIVSRATGSGRARSFSLGLTQSKGEGESLGSHTSLARYFGRSGRIKLIEFELKAPGSNARVSLNETDGTYDCEVHFKDQEQAIEFKFDPSPTSNLPRIANFYQQLAFQMIQQQLKSESLHTLPDVLNYPTNNIDTLSIAPIRTRPERIYDPSSEHFNPEGTHVPFVLARAFWDRKSTKEQKELISALEAFGNESGLFSGINVKNLGRRGGTPFQVLVNIAGKYINLLDVGYGVSQSLPVVVESALGPVGRLLLIQQPEVHLHPRAQAALGSFFVRLAATGQKHFVIETHSDYIVDRIRQEVAKGTDLNFDSVLILYFERKGLETTVYPLHLDDSGNILDAPATYRDFFLREEINLLSRTDMEQ